MNILHISKYYYPYIGGVENVCKYLVENMPQHQMAVLCFNEGKNDKIEVVNGIKIYRVGSWVNISRQALSLSYFTMLRKALKEFNPDIIHFHWANPFPAAVLLIEIPKGVSLIVHWHMDVIKQKKIYPLIKPIEKALLRRASLILVTSPNYGENSLALKPFKDKIRVVPNSIDERTFILRLGDEEKINSLKRKYGGKDIVFFVGRHIQYKGLQHLISAEKAVKSDCVFVIAGKGPLTEKLKSSCHSSRVHFIGKISNDELRYYLYAAKIFAFPSVTKNEAFGVALAEAMYCYTPAVTFTIPGSGVNWVSIRDKTCIEVENGNDRAYARAIDELLENKEMYHKMAEKGRLRIEENFLISNMVKACQSCYDELL
ncbi:glycosyltransferase [Prevotella denticola]|uniref:glycosyltransferase n=1 Tax=Prevotella denticola TaxID=28129 RepID=UPI001C5E162A|nr:glycosyltransferase [Prevotella denticola]MBW4713607.1 glycosyltransferase [Prevotella denticola]MBW4751264.1 glycosyltransferase [Prevotella denticola]